tara:strand:+ start:194 stop:493 length:300 start_codon:yes stop_codon:yes gene_type:complete
MGRHGMAKESDHPSAETSIFASQTIVLPSLMVMMLSVSVWPEIDVTKCCLLVMPVWVAIAPEPPPAVVSDHTCCPRYIVLFLFKSGVYGATGNKIPVDP